MHTPFSCIVGGLLSLARGSDEVRRLRVQGMLFQKLAIRGKDRLF